jgi:hypothetical protein
MGQLCFLGESLGILINTRRIIYSDCLEMGYH